MTAVTILPLITIVMVVVVGQYMFRTVVGITFKGNRTIADLKYGDKDIVSPSTLIFAPIKG